MSAHAQGLYFQIGGCECELNDKNAFFWAKIELYLHPKLQTRFLETSRRSCKKAAHLDKFVHRRSQCLSSTSEWNESEGTNVEGWRDLPLDIQEEFLQIRLGSHTNHRSKHWSEGVVWMAIQDVYFNCCIQRNKWSFHLRWQVPPNLVLCPASAGKSPENFGRFGGLLLWLRDLWYPQELNFQERTLSLLSRLQHWRMDSQFRVLHSHKHYFHERWTIASK